MTLPDRDDFAGTFGGPYSNYKSVEDPTTDVDATAGNKLMCDVAMMTHTAIRAWVVFTGITYTSGTMLIVPDDHDAMWGSSTGVRPVIDQTAAGIYHATWAASQNDELVVAHSLIIRYPMPVQVFGADGLRGKIASFTANALTLNTFSAGAANSLNGTKIGLAWI